MEKADPTQGSSSREKVIGIQLFPPQRTSLNCWNYQEPIAKKKKRKSEGSNFSLIVHAIWKKLNCNYVVYLWGDRVWTPCGDPYQPFENKWFFCSGIVPWGPPGSSAGWATLARPLLATCGRTDNCPPVPYHKQERSISVAQGRCANSFTLKPESLSQHVPLGVQGGLSRSSHVKHGHYKLIMKKK